MLNCCWWLTEVRFSWPVCFLDHRSLQIRTQRHTETGAGHQTKAHMFEKEQNILLLHNRHRCMLGDIATIKWFLYSSWLSFCIQIILYWFIWTEEMSTKERPLLQSWALLRVLVKRDAALIFNQLVRCLLNYSKLLLCHVALFRGFSYNADVSLHIKLVKQHQLLETGVRKKQKGLQQHSAAAAGHNTYSMYCINTRLHEIMEPQQQTM